MKLFESLRQRWRNEYALAEYRVQRLQEQLASRKALKEKQSRPPPDEDSSTEELLS